MLISPSLLAAEQRIVISKCHFASISCTKTAKTSSIFAYITAGTFSYFNRSTLKGLTLLKLNCCSQQLSWQYHWYHIILRVDWVAFERKKISCIFHGSAVVIISLLMAILTYWLFIPPTATSIKQWAENSKGKWIIKKVYVESKLGLIVAWSAMEFLRILFSAYDEELWIHALSF